MRVQHSKFDELRIQVVEEALERGNVALTARKHGLSPYSLYKWVKQYRDEVEMTMSRKKNMDRLEVQPQTTGDWKEKYEQATKLIGEKELEIAILRDLVKKTHPHIQWKWPGNGS
ncbi:Transposase and inactivated derivatives [Paenibacillus uliginis N3/975]|uniref:Transposase and inactivated derivatives n=1 Tax=Paenibacillus uliginis N3/975 TaxID=1313296 RepID=A0A1X7GBA0_9BACL|nr:transposase [Paenibacillus uliginis]SMF66946.1 Transposase and inactivated derivatives [Paenibacillus uliginis N3/975]SMF89871.1 Transposase and inactivated derivatives [Paenibacillus uliginis N3/975]SMF90782.1 Transposase and inactivated derivatives [Paenibacillus uliginis N3/975]SMF90922.1 Transposase and inactivated derivatives [Paenibacillus uliginis N3/975]